MIHLGDTMAVDYKQLKISSPAFNEGDFIPLKFTCEGINVNPPLNIEHIPEETKCLALVVEDPDAPIGPWVHWLAWDIPVTHHIKENEIHGTAGLNDFQEYGYQGPCPPSGTHRYFFKVYALDSLLKLVHGTKKPAMEKVMSSHIIGFGELMGVYKKQNK